MSIKNFSSIKESTPKKSTFKTSKRKLPVKKPVLMVDNYDSFTYNLVQYVLELGHPCKVLRCDEKELLSIENHPEKYGSLIISPGPGRPSDAGYSCRLIKNWAGKLPILGVCMGHQCIAEVFGGEIVAAKKILHGKVSYIKHDGCFLFAGEKNPLPVARYHSLVVNRKNFPSELAIVAEDNLKEIMALRHKTLPLWGVQFHPESIATPTGKNIVQKFLEQEF